MNDIKKYSLHFAGACYCSPFMKCRHCVQFRHYCEILQMLAGFGVHKPQQIHCRRRTLILLLRFWFLVDLLTESRKIRGQL